MYVRTYTIKKVTPSLMKHFPFSNKVTEEIWGEIIWQIACSQIFERSTSLLDQFY